MADDPAIEPLKEIGDIVPGTPIAPAHGVAAIALTMAMKYHDINTIQDGALYQQFKLEGKNMRELQLDMVFDTAARIEGWLIGSSERIAKMIVDAIQVKIVDDEEADDDTLRASAVMPKPEDEPNQGGAA